MKQPSAAAYLFGNPLSLLALIIAMLYTGYTALTGTGSGWLAIAALIAVGYGANGSRQITAYATWKREWDGMNGKPPKQPLYARHPWLRYLLGGGAWLIGAWMALTTTDHGLQWAVGLFWLATVLGIGVLLFRAAKRVRRAIPQKQANVAVCMNVPMQSRPVSEIYRCLPDYCLRLLRMTFLK